MIKQTLCIVLFLGAVHLQANTKDSSRIKISEAFIMSGGTGFSSNSKTLEDFKLLATGSPILSQNLNTYSRQGSNSNPGSLVVMGFGLQKQHSKHNAPIFRIALSYGSGISSDLSYAKSTLFRVDTLTSSQTGKQYFIDSQQVQQIRMQQNTQILQLDVSAIWRTHNPNKFKLFAGIGIVGGKTINRETSVFYGTYAAVGQYNPYMGRYGMGGPYSSGSGSVESYKNSNQTAYGVYIPFGVDYQLSKKPGLLKHFSLFTEVRYRIQVLQTNSNSSSLNANFTGNLGLRIQLI